MLAYKREDLNSSLRLSSRGGIAPVGLTRTDWSSFTDVFDAPDNFDPAGYPVEVCVWDDDNLRIVS